MTFSTSQFALSRSSAFRLNSKSDTGFCQRSGNSSQHWIFPVFIGFPVVSLNCIEFCWLEINHIDRPPACQVFADGQSLQTASPCGRPLFSERRSVSRSTFAFQDASVPSTHVLDGEAAAGHRPALRFLRTARLCNLPA